ncbi:hypothetical protein BJ912DRAFT_920927 [Pholiota molesta]|nr:hypothetical protein BJ912DRAFT_920927 [Pholiota molesta]
MSPNMLTYILKAALLLSFGFFDGTIRMLVSLSNPHFRPLVLKSHPFFFFGIFPWSLVALLSHTACHVRFRNPLSGQTQASGVEIESCRRGICVSTWMWESSGGLAADGRAGFPDQSSMHRRSSSEFGSVAIVGDFERAHFDWGYSFDEDWSALLSYHVQEECIVDKDMSGNDSKIRRVEDLANCPHQAWIVPP